MRRALLAAALLIVEFLVVTVPVDLGTAQTRNGVFALLATHRELGLTLVLGACFALVFAAVFRRNDQDTLDHAGRPERAQAGAARPFSAVRHGAAHGLTFLVFAALTLVLFRERPPPWLGGNAALGTWGVLGCLNLLTLGCAVFGSEFLSRKYLLPLGLGASLGGLTHLAGLMSRTLWDSLSGATFHLALVFLRGMFPDASGNVDARLLGARDFYVEVAAGCSGFEGLGVAIVYFPAFLWLLRSRYRFPQALLVVPLGLFAVWVGNALRVAAIVALGVLGHPSLAVGAFHSKIGWAVLTAVCLALSALSLRVRWLSNDPPASRNAAVPFLAPQLLILCATLLTGLLSDGHDPLYPVRVVLGGWALLFWFEKTGTALVPVPAKAILVGALVGAVWIATDRGPAVPDAALPPEQLWQVMRLIGAVVVIPICEELAFRGFLMRRMIDRDFTNVPYRSVGLMPVLLSSLVFGAVHGRPVAGTLSGLVFAWLARKGLGHAIWAHAAANLAIGVWVLSSGESWHW